MIIRLFLKTKLDLSKSYQSHGTCKCARLRKVFAKGTTCPKQQQKGRWVLDEINGDTFKLVMNINPLKCIYASPVYCVLGDSRILIAPNLRTQRKEVAEEIIRVNKVVLEIRKFGSYLREGKKSHQYMKKRSA